MAFEALEVSLQMLEALGPVEAKVHARRKSLADQIARAGESVALNVSEGRMRVGLDRPDLYRRAAGSAAELTTALGSPARWGSRRAASSSPSRRCSIACAPCCGGSPTSWLAGR